MTTLQFYSSITASAIIAGIVLMLVYQFFKHCISKSAKEASQLFQSNESMLLNKKWDILGKYRGKLFEHKQNIICGIYDTNDQHNLKVLMIELIEFDGAKEHDFAMFNLIDLGTKSMKYELLKYKFISESEFEELKQISSQLNPNK